MEENKLHINEKEEINNLIYDLRKKGLSYRKIEEELKSQGIKICRRTITKICNEIYTLKGEKQPELKLEKKKVKEEINNQIYDLRKKGLSYRKIEEELKKQGIKISRQKITEICNEIYTSKGEEQPKLKRGTTKGERVKDEYDEYIYKLREQGLSHTKIVEELETHGIKISKSTVVKICKELYEIKGKSEPKLKRGRKKLEDENIDNLIYDLREQGLGYIKIAKELEKQDINIAQDTVKRICNEIYISKGEKNPELKTGRRKIQYENINNLIYNLREQGLSYSAIAEELEKQRIKISIGAVRKICKDIYISKGQNEPKSKKVKSNIKINEILEVNRKIYELREKGLAYRKIVKELELEGIKLSVETVRKRCKELYEIKGKNEPELRKKDIDNEQIYILRKQGLSYLAIAEELEKQGIKISTGAVRKICEDIYISKGENEPKIKYGKTKKIINESQELNEKIYELREKGLTHRKIAEELELQGIKLCMETIRKRCKELYEIKGKSEPELKRGRKKLEDENINNLIYNLRKEGLSYSVIVEELEKQGIKIGSRTIGKICEDMYISKGQNEPKIKYGQTKERIDESQKLNEIIYELREKRLSYSEIVKELELQGIKLGITAIHKRCKEVYELKGKTEPELIKKEVDKEQIYILREQGLSYSAISEELEKQGLKIAIMTIRRICKEIYTTKGKIEPKAVRNKKNDAVPTEPIEKEEYKKINEQQLAKAILNLMTTRNATLEQVKIIADYYGVDLEKTMNSLEER